MNAPQNTEPPQPEHVDPLDVEAAHIDARSDDVVEEIAELVEHAREMGRDVSHSPIPPAGD
jgi:hypothetical protein